MEIGSGKKGCFKSQQGYVRSGHKGRKEGQGRLLHQLHELEMLMLILRNIEHLFVSI